LSCSAALAASAHDEQLSDPCYLSEALSGLDDARNAGELACRALLWLSRQVFVEQQSAMRQ
jgi:hypothetical protein